MTAIEIFCRLCYSRAYQMCQNIDGSKSSYTHRERFEDAAAITSPVLSLGPGMKEAAFVAEDGF